MCFLAVTWSNQVEGRDVECDGTAFENNVATVSTG